MCIKINYIVVIYYVAFKIWNHKQGQTYAQDLDEGGPSSIPITIKDDGVKELTNGDVAMIFYITVTNIGQQPVHLSVNNTRCCQTISKEDEDCQSMKLLGGSMGELFPQDTRNLTLIYANLYLHNRVGSCDMEIADKKGERMARVVKFNTTLVKVLVPRLLQHYYEPDNMMPCTNVDEDPLNTCRPYSCEMRYDGTRNFFNYTSKRCENLPACVSENEVTIGYVVDTNTCLTLKNTMTAEEFAEFPMEIPSVSELSRVHGYPINVHCHNGVRDQNGRWCECRQGWRSSPFEHKYFNPDVQVYHMCTVWTGEMSADEARNITVIPPSQHKTTITTIFCTIGIIFMTLCGILAFIIYRQRWGPKTSDGEEESASQSLFQDSEYDS